MDLKGVITNEKNQAMPAGIVSMGSEAFAPRADTTLTWLGGACACLSPGRRPPGGRGALSLCAFFSAFLKTMPALMSAGIECGRFRPSW